MNDVRLPELKQALLSKWEVVAQKSIDTVSTHGFADLSNEVFDSDARNKELYEQASSVDIYRNFLNWLFATFKTDEFHFRKSCIEYLGDIEGKRVLVTSCGLGEDIKVVAEAVGLSGFVHAQDLSRYFVELAAEKYASDAVVLTISNALDLPYKDDYFDAVYHFGGINLFGDLPLAISEMNRVCKPGGRVLFGDESVANHLRDSDYGKMFIENNALWKEAVPLEHLPAFATDIQLNYVLGNCFYLLGFSKGTALPEVDADVEHIGYRGGSARKRYFGKLEGIDLDLKTKLYELAKKEKTSVSKIMEHLLQDKLSK